MSFNLTKFNEENKNNDYNYLKIDAFNDAFMFIYKNRDNFIDYLYYCCIICVELKLN